MSEPDDVDTVKERLAEDRQNIHIQNEYQDISYTIIKARIGMLATAIGGPDHSVDSVNPPYKAVSYTHLDVYKRQDIVLQTNLIIFAH